MRLNANWSWIRSVEAPELVNDDHIKIAYRLDLTACPLGACEVNCKTSPLCLNGLSQLHRNIALRDAETECKRANVRNGLKNYGNTCYLNAFLQLYFQFRKLREAVYKLPSDCDGTGIIYQLQVIFSQLQLSNSGLVDPGGLIEALRLCEEEQQDAPEFHCLFMNLLETRFQAAGHSVIDELLRGEYVYETRCLNCGLTSRQSSQFLELSLKVSSPSLIGCIKDYLKEEALTGENQYACSHCKGKQDGVRRAYITRSPSMLCIQLLRFTYDPRTGQRRKQKTALRIPDRLYLKATDSSAYSCPMDSCTVPCLNADTASFGGPKVYQMRGVLVHIGSQPTCGHYVAVVRCSDAGSMPMSGEGSTVSVVESESASAASDHWLVCNDMDVHIIPDSCFNLNKVNGSSRSILVTGPKNSDESTQPHVEVSSLSVNKQNSRKGKRRKQLNTSALSEPDRPTNDIMCGEDQFDGNDPVDTNTFVGTVPHTGDAKEDHGIGREVPRWHVSSNAYMLFYQSLGEDNQGTEPSVPSPLRQMVEEVNTVREQDLREKHLVKANQVTSVYNLLAELAPPPPSPHVVPNSDGVPLDAISLVPTAWLSEWLDRPDQPPSCLPPSGQQPSPPGSADEEPSAAASLFSFPSCPHGHFPVDQEVSSYRAVSTQGLSNALRRYDPSYQPGSLLDRLKPCRACVCLNVALVHLERRAIELARVLDQFSRSQRLAAATPQLATTTPTYLEPSIPAIATVAEDKPMTPADASFFWIGKLSLRYWRHLARAHLQSRYAVPTLPVLPTQCPVSFNVDAVCCHGRLKPTDAELRRLPAALWKRLLDFFLPDASPVPSFPVVEGQPQQQIHQRCSECTAIGDCLARRALHERNLLPDLVPLPTAAAVARRLVLPCMTVAAADKSRSNSTERLRPVSGLLDSGDVQDIDQLNQLYVDVPKTSGRPAACIRHLASDPDALYLIPVSFIASWRRFLRSPSLNTLPEHLLSATEGDQVLCQHGHVRCTQLALSTVSRPVPPIRDSPFNSASFCPCTYQLTRPWQELISESILFPLTAYEWAVFSHIYDHRNCIDEGCRTSPSPPPEPQMVTLRLLPNPSAGAASDGQRPEEIWTIDPPAMHTFCSACYASLISERNSYHNARLRVRLVNGAAEAMALSLGQTIDGTGESRACIDLSGCCTGEEQDPMAVTTDVTRAGQKRDFPWEDDGSASVQEADISFVVENDHDTEPAQMTASSESTSASCKTTVLAPAAELPPSSSNGSLETQSYGSVRRSTRQRSSSSDLLVMVSSKQTVQKTKVQIMQHLGVTPADQHLIFQVCHCLSISASAESPHCRQGVELNDSTKSLQEVGVKADSLIFLWADYPGWETEGTAKSRTGIKSSPKPSSDCKPILTPLETGFKGTRLMDN